MKLLTYSSSSPWMMTSWFKKKYTPVAKQYKNIQIKKKYKNT
ncbi:MAG: hypothetical protein SO206_03660 [Bacilli bacterium]|nr:hypothetical protein [Bacilli bacterium]